MELADFYVKCVVTNKVVTSTVNGQKLCFDASDLDELVRVLAEGFDVHEREDKSVLGDEQLLELTQRLTQKHNLTEPWSVQKGECLHYIVCCFGLSLRMWFPDVMAAILLTPWRCVLLVVRRLIYPQLQGLLIHPRIMT